MTELEYTVEIDGNEMTEELGITQLEEEVNGLRSRVAYLEAVLTDVLTYINAVDLRVQQLNGEPVVSGELLMHMSNGGLNVTFNRPEVPGALSATLDRISQGRLDAVSQGGRGDDPVLELLDGE